MLELNIKCETVEEAQMYLNGPKYYNLLDDLRNALRNAYKHGEGSSTALKVLENFYPDITNACDHHTGPY